ncbi:MAG: hypothetical protein HC871_02580 [Rhizobiales bacterium]|nr:hypothetical protein [Hyphomicrobiales bacterium]
MSSKHAAMEAALLEIAKDLLQASDDLASTDPSASAKLAHEAYEIGRDLGIVRSHLDGTVQLSAGSGVTSGSDQAQGLGSAKVGAGLGGYEHRDSDDEADAELLRILDRQKAMLPKSIDVTPIRKPSHDTRALTFESAPPKRSSWLGWMRSREWRHAG